MQPDDRLEQQLAAAGERARSAEPAFPDPMFAVRTREALLAQYPAPASEPAAVDGPRRRWFALPRPMRAAPLALAAVLAVATVVGARELYVAFVAPPDATPTPGPSAPASVETTPSVTAEPTAEPTVAPTPSATPEPERTPKPTTAPTAEPTAKPTPVPTSKPTAPPIGALELGVSGCPGGVVLDWSPFSGSGFDHYLLLRAGAPWADGHVLDGSWNGYREKTSGYDDSGAAGQTYWYRAAAYRANGTLLARSAAVPAVATPVASLGELLVGQVAEGTKVKWTPFGGAAACFTYYKVVWSLENPEPSYLAGDPAVAVGGQESNSTVLAELESGKTYYLRVQVLRATDLGSFVVAQSEVATYQVP